MSGALFIGLDFGTDSLRAALYTDDGACVASRVAAYKRWQTQAYCDPAQSRFRQSPLDYIEATQEALEPLMDALSDADKRRIQAIGLGTTGSTPIAIGADGAPLSFSGPFQEDPDCQFILWKDHTALREADDINALAGDPRFDRPTLYCGGYYSPEWFWSKILHVIRHNPTVAEQAHSWVEHCDWMVAHLTGVTRASDIKRSQCAAGHKAMWRRATGGLPARDFLSALHPSLGDVRDRLYDRTYTATQSAGTLSPEWADRLGLSDTVIVSVGALDAHMGAIGCGISEGTMVKVIGTSTCDMALLPKTSDTRPLHGIAGQVPDSIVPGFTGLEAGQSAFGDVYAWFARLLSWGRDTDPASVLSELGRHAATLPDQEPPVLALDWFNGRRTPDMDMTRKGVLANLTLGHDAPHLFKALVEATAFGARAIQDRFTDQNVPIHQVLATGGIALKSDFVMQTLASVLNRPISVSAAEYGCARGAAMCAAVAAGRFSDLTEAQKAMSAGLKSTFTPEPSRQAYFEKTYAAYRTLGDAVTV